MRVDISRTGGKPVSLADIGQESWKIVLYGPPGAGKSCTAAVSQWLRVFVIDVDHGTNAVAARYRKLGLDPRRVTIMAVNTPAEFENAVNYFCQNANNFDMIVIDSATELQRKILFESAGKGYSMDQQKWGRLRMQMEDFTVWLRELPKHVMYVCHEHNKWDPMLGQVVWRPSFDGRFAFEYAKHFDAICRVMAYPVPTGQMDALGQPAHAVQRLLNFGPDPYAHFKDRSGSMNTWEVPDIDSILSRMIASTTEPATQQAQGVS